MTLFLILLCFLTVSIIAFTIWNKKEMIRFDKDFDVVCQAHKKLGYPKIEKREQFKIMESGDLSPISNLIPELKGKGTPFALLKYYITITKEEFKEHLLSSDFLERHKIENAPNPKHDGLWIVTENLKLKIIDQERGHIDQEWLIKNERKAVDIYADRLWFKLESQ